MSNSRVQTAAGWPKGQQNAQESTQAYTGKYLGTNTLLSVTVNRTLNL